MSLLFWQAILVGVLEASNYLCHYTRAAIAFEEIIPNQRLKMSPYSRMRDPFENKLAALPGSSGALKLPHEIYFEINRRFSRARDAYRLLSVTRADDRPGDESEAPFRVPWARPRMWEQYAERHAGVCLVFEREALIEAIERQIPTGLQHGPVHYTVGGLRGNPAAHIHLDDYAADRLEEQVASHVETYFEDFFMLKTDDWAAEWEYRFVSRITGTPNYELPRLVSCKSALRYVVIGERFPTWQIAGARHVVEDAGAELLQMSWTIGIPQAVPPPRRVEIAARPEV